MRRLLSKLAIVATVVASVFAAPRDANALSTGLCVSCTGTPTFTISGNILAHAEVAPVFWGSYWNTASPGRGHMVGTLQAALNGAYFASLEQYGVGPARLVPAAPIYTGTTPGARCKNGTSCFNINDCTDGSECMEPDVIKTINASIGNGSLPPPVANADMLYLLFVPPGTINFDYNDIGTCDSTCGSAYNGKKYTFAWASDNDVAGMTHEMVEAMARDHWVNNCPGTSQIADLCGCATAPELGGDYAAYWSVADNACVVPEGWSSIWQFNGSGWSRVRSSLSRQVAAGNYGLVATDTDDNVNIYAGSGNWTQIGGPGAQFVVGTNSVLAIGPNADYVAQYNGSWSTIGGPATSVAGGDATLATGYDGSPWSFLGGSNWVKIGGPADQFVVNGAGVYGLALDHSSVWQNASAQQNIWTKVGGAFDELFAGPDGSLAASTLATARRVNYMASLGSWVDQGFTGQMSTAVIGNLGGANTNLFGLSKDMNNVDQSNNTSINNPTVTKVGNAAAKLFGHGWHVYEARGIHF